MSWKLLFEFWKSYNIDMLLQSGDYIKKTLSLRGLWTQHTLRFALPQVNAGDALRDGLNILNSPTLPILKGGSEILRWQAFPNLIKSEIYKCLHLYCMCELNLKGICNPCLRLTTYRHWLPMFDNNHWSSFPVSCWKCYMRATRKIVVIVAL